MSSEIRLWGNESYGAVSHGPWLEVSSHVRFQMLIIWEMTSIKIGPHLPTSVIIK